MFLLVEKNIKNQTANWCQIDTSFNGAAELLTSPLRLIRTRNQASKVKSFTPSTQHGSCHHKSRSSEMESIGAPCGVAAAEEAAPAVAVQSNIILSRHPLHYVLLHLPVHHITSFLPNTSVGFLAVAFKRSSATSNNHLANAHRDVVNYLMQAGDKDFWAHLKLGVFDTGVTDKDVHDLLSLVNMVGRNYLRSLEIIGCEGVDGSGLSPLVDSVALTSLRVYHNRWMPSRRSQRLTPGPSQLEIVRDTFARLINGRNLLKYVQVDDGWGVDGHRVVSCSNWCCGQGPNQKLYWCDGCGFGPFCEKGVGIFYVYCEDERRAHCVNCLRLSNVEIGSRCPHRLCCNWICACGCDGFSGMFYCNGCHRDGVCFACGSHTIEECPFGLDCSYHHGGQCSP